MKLDELLNKISNVKAGTFVKITYKGNPHKLAKGKTENIEKICCGVYRIGIDYSHLKINAEKVTGGLNGKEWLSYKYTLQSQDKTMLRVYTTKHPTKSVWLKNGVETTKDELVANGLVSGSTHSYEIACFDINIDNIISIG